MSERPARPAHFLLVVSIVGTILGMEIDVFSGPLAPDSLSVLLCELHAPTSSEIHVQQTALRLVADEPAAARSVRIDGTSGARIESPTLDVVWPTHLSLGQHRKGGSSTFPIDVRSGNSTRPFLPSLRASRCISRRVPCPPLTVSVCRFLC